MHSILHHINRAKERPHHERKRIAYVGAGIGAGAIGLIWLGVSLSTGAFLIHDSSLTRGLDTNQGVTAAPTDEGVAGAAAALPGDTSGPAQIQIVDAATSSTGAAQPQQTTLPF